MQTEIPPSEARETKSRFLSLEVTVEVFRWQVILQYILEKVMDIFIGADGGPTEGLFLWMQDILF